jgi:chromosome partitioning protein
MSVVAVYNLKGGVGKTTTAVNLSYLSAAAGKRTLLWDLDPQAASSFAFRIRPSVAGFCRKTLESGQAFATAIKGTDFDGLDLLPADFAYRKLDQLLSGFAKPQRVIAGLLGALGHDYDVIFLDCPPGFSLLTEGVFEASDRVLVPTIPTVLSLRTLARLIKWTDRCDCTPVLTAFLSMVDRRKTLHRQACQWASLHPEIFLAGQIPYASVVEQMAVRRMPLPAFAPGDPAATAFRTIWTELQTCLRRTDAPRVTAADGPIPVLQSLEALIAGFDSANDSDTALALGEPGAASSGRTRSAHNEVQFVHSFDTDRRDLQRCGYVLELRERSGSFIIAAARLDAEPDEGSSDAATHIQAQVDSRWAMQILSDALSPLAALERRLGRPTSWLVGQVRAAAGDRALRRVNSSTTTSAPEWPEGLAVAGESMRARPAALLRPQACYRIIAATSGFRVSTSPCETSTKAGEGRVRSANAIPAPSSLEQKTCSTSLTRTVTMMLPAGPRNRTRKS